MAGTSVMEGKGIDELVLCQRRAVVGRNRGQDAALLILPRLFHDPPYTAGKGLGRLSHPCVLADLKCATGWMFLEWMDVF